MKDTSFCANFQLNFRGNLVLFKGAVVMGIINVTPDSFYADSRVSTEEELLNRAEQMLTEGAEILDIGGYSSRPGADNIPEKEEAERVAWAVKLIQARFPQAIISIDTFRSSVAKVGLEAGAHMINDISGGVLDPSIFEVVARYRVPYVLMHMKGTPETMTQLTDYDNLIGDVQKFFGEQIAKARAAGIKDIIIDPGFGFSKTTEQSFSLLKKLEMLQLHATPLLIGVSRKSMIYKTLNTESSESLNGTTVLNTFGLSKGASILRVHDVKEAVQAITLMKAIRCAE